MQMHGLGKEDCKSDVFQGVSSGVSIQEYVNQASHFERQKRLPITQLGPNNNHYIPSSLHHQ